jgi:hypothetical protein
VAAGRIQVDIDVLQSYESLGFFEVLGLQTRSLYMGVCRVNRVSRIWRI